MKRSILLLTVAAGVVWLPGRCRGALELGSYDPVRHDRFYTGPDKAFIGEGLDFSGVGRVTGSAAGGTLGRWATLITPEYFLSARHYHPGAGDTLTFFEGDDPAGPPHSYTVSSGAGYTAVEPDGRTDIWMGKLAEPIPASDNVAYYAFSAFAGPADYVDHEIYVYGRDHRVGRNEVDWINEVTVWDSMTTATVMMAMRFDYDWPGVGGDEARIQSGDSRAPSFLVIDGKRVLVGVHYYTVDAVGGAPAASMDSFVPSYSRQLVSVIGGPIHLVAVPEPSGLLLLAAALPGALLWLRRRRG